MWKLNDIKYSASEIYTVQQYYNYQYTLTTTKCEQLL